MADKKTEKPIVYVPVDTEEPKGECWVCHSKVWRQREDGGWFCAKCHPEAIRLALPSDNFA